MRAVLTRLRPALPLLALASLALASLALAAPKAPETPLQLQYMKKIVGFPHAPHLSQDPAAPNCASCHHMDELEAPKRKCSASGCHDSFDLQDKTPKSFYKMVHGPGSDAVQSCLACHKAAAASAPDAKKRLTACAGSACHPQ